MEKDNFNFGEWIEKQKFWIGGLLLILIIVGSGFLLWRENYQKIGSEDRLATMENRISELESKAKNQEVLNNNQLNSNTQDANNQTTSTNPNSIDGGGKAAPLRSSSSAGQAGESQSNQTVGKININTANENQLDLLPGIGATYAKRIIEYRNANGAFTSIDDIKKVKGIGDKTFEKFKDKITVQ